MARSAREYGYRASITEGNGANLIRIEGVIYDAEADLILELMKKFKTSGERKMIGFELACHGGDHDSVMRVYTTMQTYRAEGFSFYTFIHYAHSAAMFIVAATDPNKRKINNHGTIEFHDGHLIITPNDVLANGMIDRIKWRGFLERVEAADKVIWSEESGFKKGSLTDVQRAVLSAQNRVVLTAQECYDQFGFKIGRD